MRKTARIVVGILLLILLGLICYDFIHAWEYVSEPNIPIKIWKCWVMGVNGALRVFFYAGIVIVSLIFSSIRNAIQYITGQETDDQRDRRDERYEWRIRRETDRLIDAGITPPSGFFNR